MLQLLLSVLLQTPTPPAGTPDWIAALGYLLGAIATVLVSVGGVLAYIKPRLDKAEEKAVVAEVKAVQTQQTVDQTTTALTQESTVVKAKVEAQGAEFELYKAQINFLWDRVTTLESSRTMDQQRYDKMLSALRDAQLELQRAKDRIADLERDLAQAQRRVAELQGECDQNKDELSALRSAIEEEGGNELSRRIHARTHRRRADRTPATATGDEGSVQAAGSQPAVSEVPEGGQGE